MSFLGSMFTNQESDTASAASKSMATNSVGSGMFSGANFGTTLQGFGTLAGTIGSIFAQNKQAKYQDKLFNMEKDRIDKERKRQDKFNNGMAKSFA